jgi:ankyrin repeat protein
MMKKLIYLGAGINIRCGQVDATVLLIAAQKGKADLVQILIDSGASVDIANSDGVTPLAAALHCSNWDVANILLRSGADPKAHRPFGLTFLDLANNAPDDIKGKLTSAGVEETPNIKITGSGSSSDGQITVHFEKD